MHFFWDAFPVGMIVHQADGGITYINQTAKNLLGYHTLTPPSLDNFAAACNLYILDSELPYPTAQLPATQALQGHYVCLDDLEIRQGDRRLVLAAIAAPVHNGLGHITHAMVALQDVTQRQQNEIPGEITLNRCNQLFEHQVERQATNLDREILIRNRLEADLHQLQTRFETLAQAIPGVIYSLVVKPDQSMQLEYVNQRIASIYETPLQNIIQAPQQILLLQMHPSDRPGFAAELARCRQSLSPFSYGWRSRAPSGTRRWLQTYAKPEVRSGGEICWHGLLLDVTERQRADLQLQKTVAQSTAMLAAIPDLIFQLNREGFYVGCVRNNPDFNVLPPEIDITGCHVSDILPPELAVQHLRMVEITLDTHTLQVFEQTLTVRNRLQYEEVRMVPCGADTVMVIVRDVSDRKAFELALQTSEAEHRAVVEALPDLMFRINREGYWLGYVHTNAQIDYLPKNYNPLGQHISDHMPPAVAAQQLQKIQQALATREIQVFEQHLEIDNRLQYEEVRIVPQGADEVLFIVRDITDRKLAELALKSSEAENRAMLSAIPDLMFRVRRDGTFLAYFKNPNTQDLLEKTENPVGRNIMEYADQNDFYRNHIDKQLRAIRQVLETREMLVYEQQIPVEGSMQYEEVRIVPSGDDEVLIIIQNIAARKQAELALQQSEAQKQAILKAIPDLMFHLRDDGLILDYLSGTNFADLLESSESHVGHNLMDYATSEALSVHIRQKMQAMQRALATGEMQLYEQETVIGEQLQHEEVRVVPVNDREVLVMIRDISDRKRIEAELRLANERLEKLSLTDSLTLLANRRSLDEHLQREWMRAMRAQEPLSFILFDLDYFKRFNDTYGHQMGDACLVQVAQAASEIVSRASDLVARYGGEEFAVVLANTDLKGAFLIAQRIRKNILQLNIPHETSEVDEIVTASLGVSSIIPPPDSWPNILIRQADQALYSAKQAGRNNCQCFISRPLMEDDR